MATASKGKTDDEKDEKKTEKAEIVGQRGGDPEPRKPGEFEPDEEPIPADEAKALETNTEADQMGGGRPVPRVAPGKKPVGTKVLRVRAKKMGYHDHARRRPGDVFDVPASMFSNTWMELAEGEEPNKPQGAQAALEQHRQEHLRDVAASKRGAETRGTGSSNVIG